MDIRKLNNNLLIKGTFWVPEGTVYPIQAWYNPILIGFFILLLYISGTLWRVPNFSLWIDLPLSFQVLCLDSASLRLHAAAFKGVLKMLFSTTGRGEIQHLSIPTDRIWYNSNTSQRDTLGTWSIWWRSEMLRICHWQIFGDTLCVCFFFKYIFLYTVYIKYKSHLYVFYAMSSENPWPNEVDSSPLFPIRLTATFRNINNASSCSSQTSSALWPKRHFFCFPRRCGGVRIFLQRASFLWWFLVSMKQWSKHRTFCCK